MLAGDGGSLEFEIVESVAYPVDLVYRTFRDRLPELAAYIPNVESIAVLEREQTTHGVRLVNQWRLEPKDTVPRIARPFVKKEWLAYLDHADWHDGERLVRWRFESSFLSRAVSVHGTDHFRPKDGGATEMALAGTLSIDLSKVRGIPRMFHRFAPSVERFLFGQVRPNLVAVVRGLSSFLDAQ